MSEPAGSGSWFGGSAAPSGPDTVEESNRVARRLSAPDTGGITRAGLPVRTPKAHLVPGAFPPTPSTGADAAAPEDTPAPDRSADAVREHLDGYRSGVTRARRRQPGAEAG